jgi:hypothetical protein
VSEISGSDVGYRLSAQDIADYHFAVRDRLSRKVRDLGVAFHMAWASVLGAAAAVAFVASAELLPRLTQRHFANEEFLLGLGFGMVFFVAASWLNYFIRRRVLLKPDGPTYAPHSVKIEANGLHLITPFNDTLHRWELFDGVTRYKGVIVLWIEPGMGIVVPRRSFADDAAATAFVDDVSRHIAAVPAGKTAT